MAGENVFVATATRIKTEYAGPEAQGTEVTTTVVAARHRQDDARDALAAWVNTNVTMGEDGVSWQLAVTGIVTGEPVDVTHYQLLPSIALIHNGTTDIERS